MNSVHYSVQTKRRKLVHISQNYMLKQPLIYEAEFTRINLNSF